MLVGGKYFLSASLQPKVPTLSDLLSEFPTYSIMRLMIFFCLKLVSYTAFDHIVQMVLPPNIVL